MTASLTAIPALRQTFAGRLDFRQWSRRTASLVSGIALSLMAGIMIAGYFGGILPLITPGDAAATAAAITATPLPYLAGVAGIFVVIFLDIVVSGAWFALFKGVNQRLSMIAAWMRVTFAGLFAMAASQLVAGFLSREEPGAALAGFESFRTIWLISLGLFGAFLLLEGYLSYRSGYMAKIFPILLAMAGVGYAADAFGVAVVEGFVPVFGNFGFVGEVAIIVWLLIKGRRLRDR